MTAVILGLGSGLSWGFADFWGGLASRRANPNITTMLVQAAGVAVLAFAVFAGGFAAPSPRSAVLAVAAGLLDGIAMLAFYRALTIGVMAIVAPVAAAGAVLPVAVDLLRGRSVSPLTLAGCALALAGIATVASERGSRRRGLGLAAVAALGFGGFFTLFGPASSGGSVIPAAAIARTASLAIVAAIAVRAPRTASPKQKRTLALVAGAGCLDAFAAVLFGVGTQYSLAGIVAVLASLYPIATIVLARAVLRERWTQSQTLGSIAAIAGVALIAAG